MTGWIIVSIIIIAAVGLGAVLCVAAVAGLYSGLYKIIYEVLTPNLTNKRVSASVAGNPLHAAR